MERPDLSSARAHLALCLALAPKSAEAHFLAAQAARRSGSYDEAEQCLNDCEQLGLSREAIALERALSRAQRGELAGVEEYLLSGINKDQPEVVLILEALSQGYLRTYRLADALHCLDLWLQRQPNNVRALLWRGEVKERRHSNAEAVAVYQHAVEVEPENDNARASIWPKPWSVPIGLKRPKHISSSFSNGGRAMRRSFWGWPAAGAAWAKPMKRVSFSSVCWPGHPITPKP